MIQAQYYLSLRHFELRKFKAKNLDDDPKLSSSDKRRPQDGERARFIFVPFLAILLRILQVYNKTSEFLLMRSEKKNEITTKHT